jgi:putative endonuclease
MADPAGDAPRRTAKQAAGDAGEAMARAMLERAGLEFVAANVRAKGGELDLVMRDGRTLVFVEVRQRAAGRFGAAADSVTAAKRRRVALAAQHYLARFGDRPPPCRIDVVAIDLGADREPRLQWMRDAF